MSDCLSQPDMTAFVNKDAPADRLAAWNRHLRTCDRCAARAVSTRAGMKAAHQTTEVPSTRQESVADPRLVSGLEPNLQLGEFILERRLGAGGMGVVYQARQVSLDRQVALKILPLGFAANNSAVERFRREARAAAKLRHPNIVTIYAEGAQSTVCYYAMEMIEGHSLDRIIEDLRAAESSQTYRKESTNPEEPNVVIDTETTDSTASSEDTCCLLEDRASKKIYFDTVARLIGEVADALDYAHREGVIHRDIKPSNLMITGDGRLVLLDFGVARIIEEQAMTLTGSFVGTPRYMSPEQIHSDSKETDHRSDIYSLGVTLYELLTLTSLFEGNTREKIINQIINEEPQKPRRIDRHIPVDLETICCKAIEKEPSRRYQSAGDFADDLRRCLDHRIIKARRVGPAGRLVRGVLHRKVTAALITAVIVVTILAGAIAWEHYTTQWAQQDAMAQIDRLAEQNEYFSAYILARKAEKYIPKDPLLTDRWPQITREHSIKTTPPGVEVFIREYSTGSTDWHCIGRSPIERARVPFGTQFWKLEKAGFMTQELIQSNDLPPPTKDPASLSARHMDFLLHKNGSFPSDMVFVPASELSQGYLWHGTRTIPSTPAFLMDKYEVTNRQFKAFVDCGAYRKPEYWQEEFVKDGKVLPWSEAVKQFRDQTGCFGPAGWRNGTYGQDQADYPVGGISWYEAMAYARFCGKHLPTIFHWRRATGAGKIPYRISPMSNFGDGPKPVGSHGVMSESGLYDGVGNVREWCYNGFEGKKESRNILGGAWGDPYYLHRELRSPWDRDIGNGLRCAQYLGGKSAVPELAFAPVEYKHRDFENFKPVSSEVLDSYINTWYKYDRTVLRPRVESVDQKLGYCRRERITFDAAYPNERVIAYLHLPNDVEPPLQTVVWFPGGGARGNPWDQRAYNHHMVAIVRSGRALVVPFYKGTYERRLEKAFYTPDGIQSRNLYVQRSQDLRRSIDYLQTRPDIDRDKLAYVGFSWGALMGPVMIAPEDRFKVGVFLIGGICACKRHPTSDPANFAPRVRIPILMINGTDDSVFPYETAQKPMFNLLGTAESHKKHIRFPGGHGIAWEHHKQCNREVVKWLDRYLGPVRQ